MNQRLIRPVLEVSEQVISVQQLLQGERLIADRCLRPQVISVCV